MLVLKFGLDPQYVLDEIEWYEINSIIHYQHLKEQEAWEQSRMIAFCIAKGNGSKINKLTDLIKFPWEVQNKKKEPQFISDEEMKRLRAKAKNIIDNNLITNQS